MNARPYDNPHFSDYRYKLSGLHDEWITTSNENRMVNYISIASGEYAFVFQVRRRDNTWSESTKINIVITPPFSYNFV